MSQRTPILLIVETLATTPAFAREARRRGLQPVFLSALPSQVPRRGDDTLRIVRANPLDLEQTRQVVRALNAEAPIVGVCSGSDLGAESAARVAAELGLPGVDPAIVARVRFKSHQRERLAQVGLDTRPFALVDSEVSLRRELERFEFPVMLKPVKGTGSIGVARCSSTEAACQHFRAVWRLVQTLHGAPAMLLEESVDGRQFGVDLIDGTVMGITEKLYPGAECISALAHEFPAQVSPEQYQALMSFASKAATACAVTRGPLHIELRFDRCANDAIRLIEVNQRIPSNLVELVHEVSGIDLVGAAIRFALGESAEGVPPPRFAFGRLEYLVAAGGLAATDKALAAQIRADPRVRQLIFYRQEGEPVGRYRDNRERLGHLICAGSQPDNVRDACAHFLAKLGPVTDEGNLAIARKGEPT